MNQPVMVAVVVSKVLWENRQKMLTITTTEAASAQLLQTFPNVKTCAQKIKAARDMFNTLIQGLAF